jgi:ATP-dependent protease ClpP protease subunit
MTDLVKRRRTLLMLAGIAVPAVARGQVPTPPAATPTVPPVVAPPTVAPTITAPTVTAPTLPVPGLAAPAVRPVAPLAPGAIDKSKAYYLFYNQQTDVASMRNLSRQLANLVEAGVEEITLVINSPGGLLAPVLNAYAFITALPVRISTHGQGLVLSSATVLFLAGQQRSSDRDTRFLFHPAQVTVAGVLTGQQIQDQLSALTMVNDQVAQIYRDRTHIGDEDIKRFQRETVIYTAEQARQFGVVQTVGDLSLPGEGKARILFLD